MLTEPSPDALAYTTARTRIGDTVEPSSPDIFIIGTKLLNPPQPAADVAMPAATLRIAIIGAATTDLMARAIAVTTIQESRFPIIQEASIKPTNAARPSNSTPEYRSLRSSHLWNYRKGRRGKNQVRQATALFFTKKNQKTLDINSEKRLQFERNGIRNGNVEYH